MGVCLSTSVSLTNSYLTSGLESTIFLPEVFGQTASGGFGNANIGAGPQDPSTVDAGDPGDPDVSNSTDIPPDASNNLGSSDLNDTVGGQDMSNPDVAAQMVNSNVNNTTSTTIQSSQAVPEFGPLPALVLGASIVFVLLVGQRAFFKLDP